MTALAYAAMILVIAGCCACAYSIHDGHRHLACLRQAVSVHALIATTLAAVAAVYAWRTVRHPWWYLGYLIARHRRHVGRCDPDGEQLDFDETRAFTAAVRSWRQSAAPEPERSRT